MNPRPLLRFAAIATALAASIATTLGAEKKTVVMIAGRPSHAPGEHEHNAGILLLKRCLDATVPGLVDVKAHLNAGWPAEAELAKADTIVIYSDGGGGHPALQGSRLDQLGREMKRGAGLVCIHYAVEVPKEKGGPQFLDWLGGYFETFWSVNPHWKANFTGLPQHPISNGVQPFSTQDEWYYHMRFKDQGVTGILQDVPPESTLSRPDGPHSGNPAVRAKVAAKKPQVVAWAYERPDNGGRGFGFTGGHFHKGWADDNQRKLVLNAILWTAKAEVPQEGVQSTVTPEELAANLDPKPKRR